MGKNIFSTPEYKELVQQMEHYSQSVALFAFARSHSSIELITGDLSESKRIALLNLDLAKTLQEVGLGHVMFSKITIDPVDLGEEKFTEDATVNSQEIQ
jgi:hypothetical protein